MKLCISAVLALLLTATACVNQAADLTLRFGTPFVTNSNLHKAMGKFAEVVAKESGGTIKVQVYADSQIGDIQQLIAGMQLGTVDMAYLGVGNSGQLKGCGSLNVSYLPYLFKSKRAAEDALNGPIFQELYEQCAQSAGVRIFAVGGDRSPRAIVTTKGPIRKPEDLNGMRLRIPPIPIFRDTFEAVGVKVVPLGLNEVYMALSRGQVDGQDNGFDLTLSFRFQEVSKFWSATTTSTTWVRSTCPSVNGRHLRSSRRPCSSAQLSREARSPRSLAKSWTSVDWKNSRRPVSPMSCRTRRLSRRPGRTSTKTTKARSGPTAWCSGSRPRRSNRG
jgi:TRAP-type C4-dicarboxylate transport system substrate-binding protein